MNWKLLMLAIFLLPLASAAETTLIAPYLCGEGLNQTCVAPQAVIVRADADHNPTAVVLLQYQLNGTSNRTNIYYKNLTTGEMRLIATNFQSALLATYDLTLGDNRKLLDAFYDAGTNKVFVFYSTSGNQGTQGTYQMTQTSSFDVATGSTASITSTSINCGTLGGVAITPYGLGIYQLNSTHYYTAFSYRRFCAAAETGSIVLTENSIPSASQIRTVSALSGVGYGSTPAHLRSLFVQGNIANKTANVSIGTSLSSAVYRIDVNFSNFGQAANSVTLVTAGGTRLGAQFFTNNTFVYVSSEDGNQEIYYYNGTTAVRETATANNEVQYGNFNSSDGTQYFTYYIAALNTTYYDVACSLNNKYGFTCAGVSGGGLVCQSGYTLNEFTGLCDAIPGFNFKFPTVKLVVYSTPCSSFVLNPFTPYIKEVCPQSLGYSDAIQGTVLPGITQYWVSVRYTMDDKALSPFTVNTTFDEIAAGASCVICRVSDGSCNAFLPGSVNSTAEYRNSLGVETGGNYFTKNLNAFSIPPSEFGTLYQVTCTSNFTGSSISTRINLQSTQGTQYRLTGNSLASGFAENNINSIIEGQVPISVARRLGVTAAYSGLPALSWGGETSACWYRIYSLLSNDNQISLLQSRGTQAIGETLYSAPNNANEISVFATAYTPENYRVVSECYNNIDTRYSPETWLKPASTVQTNLLVKSACANVPNQNASINARTANKNGTTTTAFTKGENIYVYANYRRTNGVPVASSDCTASLINVTSGQTLLTTYMTKTGDGTFFTYYQDDPAVDDPETGLGANYNIFPDTIASGNYQLNLSCRGLSPTECVLPVTRTLAFSFNSTDSCAATTEACTINACAPCETSQVTCENGRRFNVADACISRTCIPTTSASDICANQQLYSITASVRPEIYACGTDDASLHIQLLKQGVQLPPLTLPDLSCTVTFVKEFGGAFGLPPQTLVAYNIVPSGGAEIVLPFKGRFDAFELNACGSQINAKVSCYSTNFTAGAKNADARFTVGDQGNDCIIGDGVVVRDAQCKYSVTKVDLDKGQLCVAGRFAENSNICGCPTGTTYNATSGGCAGSTAISQGLGFLGFGWLTLPNALILLFLAPLAIRLFSILRRPRGAPFSNPIPGDD